METLFDMLNVDEVRKICLQFRVPWKNRKAEAVKKLIEVSKAKPIFASIKSPQERLREIVMKTLGHCVFMKYETVNLFDRIITLFTPWEEISSTFSDMFLKIAEVKNGLMIYPETPVKNYPRFRNRDHLFKYANRILKYIFLFLFSFSPKKKGIKYNLFYITVTLSGKINGGSLTE